MAEHLHVGREIVDIDDDVEDENEVEGNGEVHAVGNKGSDASEYSDDDVEREGEVEGIEEVHGAGNEGSDGWEYGLIGCSNQLMQSHFQDQGSTTPNGRIIMRDQNEETETVAESVEFPREGVIYQSWQDIESSYRKYARQVGFKVVRASAGRRVNKVIRNMLWTCERAGNPDRRKRSQRKKFVEERTVVQREEDLAGKANMKVQRRPKSKKVGCTARLYASLNEKDLWEIRSVVLDHTGHNLTPDINKLIQQSRTDGSTTRVKSTLANLMEMGLKIPQADIEMAEDLRVGSENDVRQEGQGNVNEQVHVPGSEKSDAWEYGVTGCSDQMVESHPQDQGLTRPNDNVRGLNEETVTESVELPNAGMIFQSWHDIDLYYKNYAARVGFNVVRAGSGRRKNNVTRNVLWTCDCAGKRDSRSGSKRKRVGKKRMMDGKEEDSVTRAGLKVQTFKSKKVGCTARVYASLNGEDLWQIRNVVLDHTGHIPPHQDAVSSLIRSKLVNEMEVGLENPEALDTIALEQYGADNMPIGNIDAQNEVAKTRRLKLHEGDAEALMKYFRRMHEDNQNFFHSCRIDDDGCLQDVLWVDARSRAAYEEFGDVVCFDTTYLTNGYDLPLANFVGVNHHGQTILLGCALVSHEMVDTFEWIFETWLFCMGRKAPKAILTNQAPSVREALANVMPSSRHRWCLWHILQEFPKSLGVYPRYKEFNNALMDSICDSISPKEFENRWDAVMEQYQLVDCKWLEDLYLERYMWVPAYNNEIFWAGIKCTQKVERMKSFFDNYVDKHTRLCEFADKYCFAMEKRVQKEKEADAKSSLSFQQFKTDFLVERVFQRVYTDKKFIRLQKECEAVLYCNNRHERPLSENLVEHDIEDRVKRQWSEVEGVEGIQAPTKRTYRVTFDTLSNNVNCECKMFECTGIMCRHSIRVFDLHNVLEVPERYILQRWRKDIRRKHTMVKVAYDDPTQTDKFRRYDKMMVSFEAIAGRAMENDDAVGVVMKFLEMMDIRVCELHCATTRRPSMESVGDKDMTWNQES